ncbi:MAG: HD-GYP domain-containing protein, partial [Syntrophorhabdaceae bacterium]|nr:HD-GYP domain-containing protein [Syntrophorhabdaceae bacterium]
VVSIGLTEGRKKISIEDIQVVQNLAAQIAVALENAELKQKEEKAYIETVAALSAAVEARDTLTKGHSRRVTEFSMAIARDMKKPDWFMKDVESAALLHDIGKIGFSDNILWSPDPVPLKDLALIHNHPIMGESILKPVGSLSRLCSIIRHHHERYDGSGYPDGLKGEDIPLASRIIAVADSFDAMISGRRYLPNREIHEVINELNRCSGTQFDPSCVKVFLNHLAGSGVLAATISGSASGPITNVRKPAAAE